MESLEPVFTLLRVILALAAVLALIWLFGRRLAKRSHTLSRGRIRTIARQGLGPRQSVQVLDVDQTRYVLGVADHSVSVLDSYPVPAAEQPAAQPDDADAGTSAEAGASFAGHLSAAQSEPSAAAPPQTMPAQSMSTQSLPSQSRSAVSLPPPSGGFQIERARIERAQADRAQLDQHQVEPPRGGGSILSPRTWRQAVDAIRRGPQR